MNPTNPFSPKPSQNPQFNTFLESLREKSGFESATPRNSFVEQLNHKKEIEKQRVAEFHRSRLQEWHSLYSAKERQTQKAIENIRQELKKLAKDIARFDSTITQTVFAPIKKPGIYHQSFLEHIQQIIMLIRQQINDSNSWLSLYRQKSLKQGHYWQQASKGGTSFMLNNERQIATAVG